MNSSNIISNSILSYLNDLYSCEHSELALMREFGEQNHVPIILKDTEDLLKILIKLKKPSNILEIGTAIGYSASMFCLNSGCRVTTIESDFEVAESAKANIEKIGLSDRIKVISGDAREVLPDLIYKKEKFDFAFIDAAKSHYREFWDHTVPLLTNEALVVCDNVLMKGMTASDEFDTINRYKTSIRKMREFISYIKNCEMAETSVLPVGDGVSISIINKNDI